MQGNCGFLFFSVYYLKYVCFLPFKTLGQIKNKTVLFKRLIWNELINFSRLTAHEMCFVE